MNRMSSFPRVRSYRSAGLGLIARLMMVLFLVCPSTPHCALLAAVPSPAAKAQSNRWLFILQTSRSMQPRSDGCEKIIASLLQDGAQGQLRAGDTIGLWTFNERISAGQLPLQVWSPEEAATISKRTVEFLRGIKYEKRSSLSQAVRALGPLVTNSQTLTVILLTDGLEKLDGMAFSADVNAFFELWRKQSQASNNPFVTVLRARGGQILDFTVNIPPWPLKLPPLPSPPIFPEPAVQAPRGQLREGTVATSLPPLILSGRKTQAPRVMSTLPQVVTTQTPPTPIAAAPNTNRLRATSPLRSTEMSPTGSFIPPPLQHLNAQENPPLIASEPGGLSSPAFPQGRIWMLSGLLAGMTVVLVILRRRMLRRARSRSSLITRSLGRDGG